MIQRKTAVLLVNVGTPDSPDKRDVRRYLFRFLNDRRVIDLPWLFQKLLVNLFIVPFRVLKSSKMYQKIWTEKGSPLLVQSLLMQQNLQQSLEPEFDVYLGMRYGHPGLKMALWQIKSGGYNKLVVIPLFPHYASSTTGSVVQKIMELTSAWNVFPEIIFAGSFFDHPLFLKAWADRISSFKPETYDHILFSYHGLPERQINKVHPGIDVKSCNCHQQMPDHGRLCYRAACFETTRLLALQLNLAPDRYSVAFQSRLDRNWLSPFTDRILIQKALDGAKRVLIVSPSFVTDCLETIYEIDIEYNEVFKKYGGEKIDRVPALNDHYQWIETLRNILIQKNSNGV